METLDNLLSRITLTDISILEQVDEYTLYCHYLGFEPQLRTSYRSFVRRDNEKADENPSFSLFMCERKPDREYIWKDSGLGISGDIFKLVMLMYGYQAKMDAWKHVAIDFGLKDGEVPEKRIVRHSKPEDRPASNIRIASRPFELRDAVYWRQFGIGEEQLLRYQVKALKYYWLSDFQPYPSSPIGLGYSYEILQKYKIYMPMAPKTQKFRNNFTERCLEGFSQLKYKSDTLIITKSTKDIMTLDALGYEAVSPRGESILVPDEYLRYFHSRYQRILILFDNDMKHKGDEYDYEKVYVPILSGAKDISDYRKAYGAYKTSELLKQLTDKPSHFQMVA